MLHSYATLAQLRARQGDSVADTSNDAKYLAKLRRASALIDAETGRRFQPVQAALKFDYEGPFHLLWRGFDLLALTGVEDAQGTVDPAALLLLGSPAYGVEIDGALAYLTYGTTKIQAITVTGVWGWHDDYANAWHSTGQTVQDAGGISASATTITVTAAGAADVWGQAPCLSAGHLVQVESEWMQVLVTTATTISVVRGVNGTTPVTHANGKPISVCEAPTAIQEMCLLWAAYLVAQDSAAAPGKPDGIDDGLRPYCRVRVA
jgi:hypothetical protein